MTQAKFVFKVSYRSAVNGRVVRFFVKVPYGAAYDLSEALMRAYVTGQIKWYRVEDLKPNELTKQERLGLVRWTEALRASTLMTKVRFGE